MTKYSLEGYRRANQVRVFGREHIRHTKDRWAGQPFVLEDWQWKKMILPVYGTLRRDGKRKYTKAYFSLPRWNGKDELAALLHHYHMEMEPIYDGEQYAVASSDDQAGILFDTVRKMGNADPLLRSLLSIGRKVVEVKETGCVFKTLPHNADTAQGFHGSFVVVDELHVHRNRKMLTAMTTGMVGRQEPLLIVISTVGEQRKGVWWDVLKEWKDDPEAYVYHVGATDEDDCTDPATWRKCNPASWLTEDQLRRQIKSIPLADFERYHCNRAPKKGAGRVFSEALWASGGERPQFDPELPCVVGVDASQRRDHTGVVFDQVDAAGVHNVLAFEFEAEEEGNIMSEIDRDDVADLLRELHKEYNVVRMPFDRNFATPMMNTLYREGLRVEDFAQSNENMRRACQRIFDVVAEGRIRHGNDPRLRDHVLNATIKTIPNGGGFRFIKPSESDADKIDLAIALTMAVDIAEVEHEQGGGVGVSVG